MLWVAAVLIIELLVLMAVARWLMRSKDDDAAARADAERREVSQAVAALASLVDDQAALEREARSVAERFGSRFLEHAATMLHGTQKPAHLKGRFEGLGEWMSACQEAIIEVAYHLREQALPFLRQIAFGPYDWTQPLATAVLCRLALEGLETDALAGDIAAHLEGWRYEQLMASAPAIARLTPRSRGLEQAYEKRIADLEDVDDKLRLVDALARANPPAARRQRELLGSLMRAEGDRPPQAGATESEGAQDAGPEVETLTAQAREAAEADAVLRAIHAATLLLRLFPDDEEARGRLSGWAETHPREDVRRDLRAFLESTR